jgi:cholesterol transport system auxiliary component
MVKNKPFVLWIIVTTVWLSGCSVIRPTPSPAIDVYTLSQQMDPTATLSEIKASKAVILALSPIRSPQGLLSTGIIYRDTDYGFNSYAYSRWSDNPSKLLASYLQQSLAQSKHISAVIPVGSRADTDLLLEATIVDFSHHLQANDAGSTGVVSIIFYLINQHDKTLLATKQFTKEVTADQNNAKYAAIAINQASQLVAVALQAWLEQQIINLAEK